MSDNGLPSELFFNFRFQETARSNEEEIAMAVLLGRKAGSDFCTSRIKNTEYTSIIATVEQYVVQQNIE